jgi:hypothetical protein
MKQVKHKIRVLTEEDIERMDDKRPKRSMTFTRFIKEQLKEENNVTDVEDVGRRNTDHV